MCALCRLAYVIVYKLMLGICFTWGKCRFVTVSPLWYYNKDKDVLEVHCCLIFVHIHLHKTVSVCVCWFQKVNSLGIKHFNHSYPNVRNVNVHIFQENNVFIHRQDPVEHTCVYVLLVYKLYFMCHRCAVIWRGIVEPDSKHSGGSGRGGGQRRTPSSWDTSF